MELLFCIPLSLSLSLLSAPSEAPSPGSLLAPAARCSSGRYSTYGQLQKRMDDRISGVLKTHHTQAACLVREPLFIISQGYSLRAVARSALAAWYPRIWHKCYFHAGVPCRSRFPAPSHSVAGSQGNPPFFGGPLPMRVLSYLMGQERVGSFRKRVLQS